MGNADKIIGKTTRRLAPAERGASRPDDGRLWEVLAGIWSYPAFLVAHQIKLFELLSARSLTLEEVAGAKGLERRPAEALLAVCTSLGFVEKARERYRLTPLSRTYLLESSPTYFGHFLDGVTQLYPLFSVENVRRAAQSNSPQSDLSPAENQFEALGWQAERVRMFTRAMHSLSVAPAMAWPAKLDLSKNSAMLDIGGGSGAHAIGAVRRRPKLRATVIDAGPVCEVAREYINRAELSNRITTHVADMWNDPFPEADLHFYSYIFHDWPPDKCRILSRKSFDALPSGGRIVVHEALYNNQKTGPFAAGAYSMIMLGWTTGRQYSGKEISEMLAEAGFVGIQIKPTFGFMSIVTGRKP